MSEVVMISLMTCDVGDIYDGLEDGDFLYGHDAFETSETLLPPKKGTQVYIYRKFLPFFFSKAGSGIRFVTVLDPKC
jgi:hypothetical protein